jgi:hypothetical protein
VNWTFDTVSVLVLMGFLAFFAIAFTLLAVLWMVTGRAMRRDAAMVVRQMRETCLEWAAYQTLNPDWKDKVKAEDVLGDTAYLRETAEIYEVILTALGEPVHAEGAPDAA